MQQEVIGPPSRRRVLKYGLLSTIGFSVSSGMGGATVETSNEESETAEPTRGVMFPYQYVPGGRGTITDALEWHPRSLEGAYRTYILSYQSTPSYQVYLFVDTTDGVAEIHRVDGNDDGPFEVGTDVSVGRIHGSPSGTKRSFVTVDLEDVTDHSVDSSM